MKIIPRRSPWMNQSVTLTFGVGVAVLLLGASASDASFVVPSLSPPALVRTPIQTPSTSASTSLSITAGGASSATSLLASRRSNRRDPSSQHQQEEQEVSFLLKDFVMYNGEVLDPYVVLKINRQADTAEIKEAYRRLSRLYHPDVRRYKDILPGSCNNEMEVRDHWERISMSYRILSNPVRRRKYDRHEALADPAGALRRAAARAAWSGAVSAGKGLWNVGSHAVTTLAQQAEKAAKTRTTTSTSVITSNKTLDQGTATVVEYKSRSVGRQASKTGAFHPPQPSDDDKGKNKFNRDSQPEN